MIPGILKDRIEALLGKRSSADMTSPSVSPKDTQLAAAVLMMEVARMDERVDPQERERIAELLAWKFKIGETDAAALLSEAEAITDGPAHWHRFAATLRDGMEASERLQIVDLLWDVVYTDGRLHHLETSLMRRVTSLLSISDTDSGLARKRARRRYGLPEDPDRMG